MDCKKLALGPLVASSILASSAAWAQPNYLIIMADDVDVESFEAYSANPRNTHDNNAPIRTPNISSLAGEGVLFRQAFTTPLCTPTRAFLMTGKYNYRNYRNFGYLDNSPTTFAQVLRDHGYTTAVAGKWQLSSPDPAGPRVPPSGAVAPNVTPADMRDDYGFDTYLLWQFNYVRGNRGSRFWNPRLETPSVDGSRSVLIPTTNADYGPDLFVNFLKDFISDSAANDIPFCAYYPMVLPHDPWVSTPANVADKSGDRERYWGDNIEYLDHLVGELVRHLDDPDGDPATQDSVRDDTIIIFLSDNGTSPRIRVINDVRGNVQGDKGTPSYDGTHIPFVVSWRNRLAPEISDRMVDTSDVFATLLAAANIPEPEGLNLDGIPFLDATGNLLNNRAVAYIWYDPLGRNFPTGRFAQNTEYKLYDTGRFIRVATDPLETDNLASRPLTSFEQQNRDQLQAVLDFHAPRALDRAQAPQLSGWEREPRAGGRPGSSNMQANASDDLNDPVTWQFENITTGEQFSFGTDRSFQEGNIASTGDYAYRFRARDLFGNTSTWSSPLSVRIVADLNPSRIATENLAFDGSSGRFNLGQSFTIPQSTDGWILQSIEFYAVAASDGGNQWHLSIYDSFTDLNTRGNLLAVSKNAVVNPRTEGTPMTWVFENLILESGREYFALVSDGEGQALASGQGVPTQRNSTDVYGGGSRLKESGSDSLDLKFQVSVFQYPRTYDQWVLSLPEGADQDFLGKESPESPINAFRYFFGEDAPRTYSLSGDTISFPFAFGPTDIDWKIRTSTDLGLPPREWEFLLPDDPEVVIDWENGTISTTTDGDRSFFILEIERTSGN